MENSNQATGESTPATTAEMPLQMSAIDELLDKVDLSSQEGDDPIVGFDDVTEDSSKDGHYTSLGFAKLHPGWKCVGFLIGSGIVDSNYDSSAGQRKQKIFFLRGTVRAILAGSDAVGDVKGTIKLSQSARLRESLAEVVRDEKRTGKKIPIQIEFLGREPDTFEPDGVGPGGEKIKGAKKRSGAQIWKVTPMRVVPKPARS